MVTALVLQLIQCSVKIEKKSSVIVAEEVSPEVLKVRNKNDNVIYACPIGNKFIFITVFCIYQLYFPSSLSSPLFLDG